MNQKIIKTIIFTLFFTSSFISFAEEEIPLSAYGSLPETSMMTISPSGKFVGFRKRISGKDMYLVYDLANSKVIRSLNIDDTKPTKVYFVKDDQLVLVAGKRQQTHGFYSTSPQDTSYSLGYNLTKNKLYRLLTPGKGIYDNQWGLGYIAGISSDQEYAYLPAWVGGVAFGEWDGLQRSLMRTRIGSKRKPKIFATGTEYTKNFVIVNDKVLAREEYNNKENLYQIQAYRDNNWVTIYSKESMVKPYGIYGIMPNHKEIVVGRYKGSQKNTVLYTMSLETGELSDEPLFARDDASVEDVITDIDHVVYGAKYSGFLPKYELFDKSIEKRINTVKKSFANTAVHLKGWSQNWKQLLFYIEGQESSGEYIIINEKNEMNVVAEARSKIPYTRVNPISTFTFKARDGLKIPTLMTYPKDWDGKSKLPTIMVPHGGPESYTPMRFDWMVQYFAEQGYLVIQPQFRGSKGFGHSFTLKGRGEWGKKMQTDLTDALNVLVKKGMADPERACIVGESYGGYAALAAGALTPEIYKCIVSYNGISDLELMLNNEKQKYGKDHWVLSYWDKVIIKGAEREALFKEISPINHIQAYQAPVLLIHSEHDITVDFEQSEKMHDALLDAGKKSTLVELEEDDHYLSFNSTRLKTLEEIAKFLKMHI